jgi:hypothetical protein
MSAMTVTEGRTVLTATSESVRILLHQVNTMLTPDVALDSPPPAHDDLDVAE